MSPAAVKKFGINILQLTINVAAVGGLTLGVLWTFARPYVIEEIDTRMAKNNQWVKDTYFSKIDDLKKEINVEEVKQANKELLKELTNVQIEMAKLQTELRMSRR